VEDALDLQFGCVGDKNGTVGYGTGKAKEVPEAIKKATDDAINL